MKKRISRPASRRPAARRPASASRKVPSRRPAVARRPVVNSTRMKQRAVRQQVVRNNIRKTNRVRPAVRPAAAPRKIMPTRRAPAALRSVPAHAARRAVKPAVGQAARSAVRRAARPGTAPAAQPGRRAVRPSQGAAGAIAAAVLPAAFVLNQANAHPDLSASVSMLQYSLDNLQRMSSFDDIIADMERVDADLKHALSLLESARDQGYRYQKDLDELAYQTASQWQSIFNDAMTAAEHEGEATRKLLVPLNTQVPQLNARLGSPSAAAGSMRSTENLVNQLTRDVSNRRSAIQGRYSEIEANTYRLNTRLSLIHWALAQLAESKFSLEDREDLVSAVKARWDREGDDDPEGVLFLTNRRLALERKEKVATKKVLFIATEKELVQEILFAEPVGNIRTNKAQSKGLFGHQDFLEVAFSGPLKTLSLHLDGQESEDWSTLLDRVRSGKIEEDRAAEGGLSFADLTGEVTQADIVAIQAEVNELQDELMLAQPRAELEDLENEVRELERDLGDLRARGYATEKGLEGDIAVLAVQWDRIKTNANKVLDVQAGVLSEQSKNIRELMGRLAGMSGSLAAARPVYLQLKSALASAEAQADAALETVYGQFEDYASEVEGLSAHLDWVDWMLDAVSTASFQLLATESGVAATEALYARPGMEPENGILYLTDQRLLWEDRVGDYELKVAVPLSQVDGVSVDVVDEDGEPDEFLVFRFSGGAPIHEARFDIAAPVGEDWTQMVGRARSGDYATNRAIALDPAELERVRNAPTQCPNCGAQFSAPILRGQTEVTCEFCGVTTRI